MAAKIILFLFLVFYNFKSMANELIKVLDQESNYVELKIIDKITSRLTVRKLKIKTLNNVKDFEIFVDKCILDKRKGFLETSALIQIKDKKDKSKDSVFLFNNWMFVSNSTINEIEHPNYDIWLKRCI
ncbi:MAG: hypothetical protein CMI73_03040 [Candidatus Pelagibacter sp.]|nr:hypothetical protein [Candidatus Pelagibacter sp.]OUV87373.1 MAG: hypothetical protein CBC96_02810 [Pelagibacteraceae bacterium TMED136]|tara:strand:+ start:7867 stop:8250 length:384 start_codon:yes stop_codon:yes gene_type:complete